MKDTRKLVHFVEWKKIDDRDLEHTMENLRDWGVSDIVAHPVWGLRDQREPGFMEKIARMLNDAGLKTPDERIYVRGGCPAVLRRSQAMFLPRFFILATPSSSERTSPASRPYTMFQ